MIIGKEFKFEAAHFLIGHEKCGQTHGHTYKVWVEVRGGVSKESGMVMDLHDLTSIVKKYTDLYDHICLNYIEPFNIIPPSCENIAKVLFSRIVGDLPLSVELVMVRVQEGEGGYAIYSN